ncbi:unnamed protein product [Kuraishia capsulata CBS 1993]|uniref:Exoribonuclease phosphorolytic domain-containing protein n=1 Tax=Kuraishia capsulata CBS 1993 TaxID=1382522 RepID=W6MLT2_9ASCO|nr:uncharacterized protein KUCA_T00003439001 [Kuraishia capsulata CBS 1993]CDK27461.1 unnamed protein product [Kuraishia capsulata CBS 1993]
MNIIDRRRLLGPPNAVPVKFVAETQEKDQTTQAPKELFMERGLVANSNGSACLESRGLVIQAIVYGPRPVQPNFTPSATQGSELMSRATFNVEFEMSPLVSGFATLDTQKLAVCVRDVFLASLLLDSYPKSTIDVHVQCLSLPQGVPEDEVLAMATNCISVALVDSGLEMRDVPVSVANDGVVLTVLNYQNDEIVGLVVGRSVEGLASRLEGLKEESRGVRREIDTFLMK